MLYKTHFKYDLYHYYAKEVIVFICAFNGCFFNINFKNFRCMKKNVKNVSVVVLWFVWVILAFTMQYYRQESVLTEWAYYLICVSGLIVTSVFYYCRQRQTTEISLLRIISVSMFVLFSLEALNLTYFRFNLLASVLVVIIYLLVLTVIAGANLE